MIILIIACRLFQGIHITVNGISESLAYTSKYNNKLETSQMFCSPFLRVFYSLLNTNTCVPFSLRVKYPSKDYFCNQ